METENIRLMLMGISGFMVGFGVRGILSAI